ncbi:PstS family phosphate ABC transporter substrate-binding protein [Sphingomonas panacisoli]|nr:substrate-binding domain-containing protein [Sphingomonas panacisoli]
MRLTLAALTIAAATFAQPAAAAPLVCAADATVARAPSAVGDGAMKPALDRLLALYRQRHPASGAPTRWEYGSGARAVGALMFDLADIAPVMRPFAPAEIAPYEHQFHGDMIKEPLIVRIGSIGGRPAGIALNRRPGAPLPARITNFIALALSEEGQRVLAGTPGFTPLDPAALADERAKLDEFVPALDPALAAYRPTARLAGPIRSVGSDGMKALMDSWECRFAALQPGIRKGEIWEHLGTLNGFDALLNGQTDIAPMGRELWPDELADWRSVYGPGAPVEIAVARGGFNTPQRTTAQAILVNPANPIRRITMAQLAGIFGADPTITRWGQLGLTGAWTDRPIHVRMPPRVAPNAMSMQMMVLNGGGWNAKATEAPIAATAKAIVDDPAAIGFGGLEEGDPTLVALDVAGTDGRYIPLTADSASTGRYALTRYMYIRLAYGAISPQVAGFLHFILSRDGQERVRYSGYFPLTAAEAKRELAKLDQAVRRPR